MKKELLGIFLVIAVLIPSVVGQLNISSVEGKLKNIPLKAISSEVRNGSSGIVKDLSMGIPHLGNISINWDPAHPEKQEAPNIMLENPITDIGGPNPLLLFSYTPDCTFTLNNQGDADGVVAVNFERGNGILIKKAYFLVPGKTAQKFNVKLELPASTWGQETINAYIEKSSQRTAKSTDPYDPNIRKS